LLTLWSGLRHYMPLLTLRLTWTSGSCQKAQCSPDEGDEDVGPTRALRQAPQHSQAKPIHLKTDSPENYLLLFTHTNAVPGTRQIRRPLAPTRTYHTSFAFIALPTDLIPKTFTVYASSFVTLCYVFCKGLEYHQWYIIVVTINNIPLMVL